MHIAEGIITGMPAVASTAVALGLAGIGAQKMNAFVADHPQKKTLLGMAGAFIFFLSLIPLPAFNGTCSHPCGTPLAGILLGPWIGITLATLSLILQAAFFGHGGFSTLGVNVLALGVAGAGSAWLAFQCARKCGLSIWTAGALGGLIGDVLTYIVSGFILALTLAHAPQHKMTLLQYLLAIYGAYLPVQGPIAIGEMFLTGYALHYIHQQRPEVLESLRVIAPRTVLVGASFVLFLLAITHGALPAQAADVQHTPPTVSHFQGMDDAVNGRMARDAGIPVHPPLFDTQKYGDLWNTLLLLGGGAAGFIIGRSWHLLFPRKGTTPVASPSHPAKD